MTHAPPPTTKDVWSETHSHTWLEELRWLPPFAKHAVENWQSQNEE